MDNDETEMTTTMPDKTGAAHDKLGVRILLAQADELKQRDVERLMREFNSQKGGSSQPEYDGRMLRAALACGRKWIKDIEPALKADEVDGLAPNKVRWFVRQIDRLYQEVTTIPPD
jgi:hypothetical protein